MCWHNGFNPFQIQPLVNTCPQYRSVENTAGKGEIALNEQFLLFPQCFLPLLENSGHCIKFKNCRLLALSFWKSLKKFGKQFREMSANGAGAG